MLFEDDFSCLLSLFIVIKNKNPTAIVLKVLVQFKAFTFELLGKSIHFDLGQVLHNNQSVL